MTNYTKEAVIALSDHFNEPDWMREFRLKAFELFESMPMPTTKDEAWRRTDLRRFKLDDFAPALNGAMGSAGTMPAYLGEQLTEEVVGGTLLQIDGQSYKYELSDELKAQGIIFCDMHTAVRDHAELAQKYFMSKVTPNAGKFAAMHGAFWRGGTFLYVPKWVKASAPLHTALWSIAGNTYTHTLVVLEENAGATFIDEYESQAGESAGIHNGVVELIVGDGANLTYVSLQDFATNLWQFTHERGVVGRDGQLDWVIGTMGSRLTKAFQTVELDGRGSWARMSGLFFADKRQHFDLDTQQNHNAPDTVSDLLYKGALKDKARSVWQGMIKALPDSQRIDGFQANRNLLLEKTARADSIPGLEIEADDVRCTHASTVGHLEETELFYLMSRGIEREQAVRMLVQGFFDPVMQRIPFEGVRNRIADRIVEKVG